MLSLLIPFFFRRLVARGDYDTCARLAMTCREFSSAWMEFLVYEHFPRLPRRLAPLYGARIRECVNIVLSNVSIDASVVREARTGNLAPLVVAYSRIAGLPRLPSALFAKSIDMRALRNIIDENRTSTAAAILIYAVGHTRFGMRISRNVLPQRVGSDALHTIPPFVDAHKAWRYEVTNGMYFEPAIASIVYGVAEDGEFSKYAAAGRRYTNNSIFLPLEPLSAPLLVGMTTAHVWLHTRITSSTIHDLYSRTVEIHRSARKRRCRESGYFIDVSTTPVLVTYSSGQLIVASSHVPAIPPTSPIVDRVTSMIGTSHYPHIMATIHYVPYFKSYDIHWSQYAFQLDASGSTFRCSFLAALFSNTLNMKPTHLCVNECVSLKDICR